MRLPRPPRRSLVLLDAVAAVGLVAFSLYAITQPWDDGYRAHAGWLDAAAVSGLAAPFALRTLAPARALGLALATQLVAGLIGPHTLLYYSGFIPLLFLVYAVARHDGGWPGRFAWLATPVVILSDVRQPDVAGLSNIAFSVVLITLVWGAGRVSRRLALQSEELSVALARLEHERAAGERQAVELERTRIAAELHDVVGHALSLMVLQTGAARTELASASGCRSVADAERRLHTAEDAGRSALEELRRTLGVLRRGVPLRMEVDTSPR